MVRALSVQAKEYNIEKMQHYMWGFIAQVTVAYQKVEASANVGRLDLEEFNWVLLLVVSTVAGHAKSRSG